MSQINTTTFLSDSQLSQAISYNKNLGLSAGSVKILQNHICDDISGEFDRDVSEALISQDYFEVPLRTQVEARLSSLGKPAIEDSWEACVKYVSDPANASVVSDITADFGKLKDDVFWSVISDMLTMDAHNLVLLLAADYGGTPLTDKVFSIRYDPKLAWTYITHIPFTDIMVSPDLDSKRVNGVYTVASAPNDYLDIQVGPHAFKDLATLKETLRHALAVKVGNVATPQVNAGLSADRIAKSLGKFKVRFSSTEAIKVIQGLGGVPMNGVADEATIHGIADFQRRSGLSVDGDLGPGSLRTMVKALKDKNLFEAAIRLIMGYYSMWEEDLGRIFYYPAATEDGLEIDSSIPGMKWVEFGQGVHKQTPEEIAKDLIKGFSPLVYYKGDHFTGPHSALLDADFIPAMKRVNAYAGQSGVKVYISGPAAASFRPEGTTVGGAIVTPSKISNHKIGHAIDMNLVVTSSGKHMNSSALKNAASWPSEVKRFIDAVRDDPGLRWGGDFNTPDVVHIDDAININNRDKYAQRFQATQTAFTLQPGIRSVSRAADEEHECGN